MPRNSKKESQKRRQAAHRSTLTESQIEANRRLNAIAHHITRTASQASAEAQAQILAHNLAVSVVQNVQAIPAQAATLEQHTCSICGDIAVTDLGDHNVHCGGLVIPTRWTKEKMDLDRRIVAAVTPLEPMQVDLPTSHATQEAEAIHQPLLSPPRSFVQIDMVPIQDISPASISTSILAQNFDARMKYVDPGVCCECKESFPGIKLNQFPTTAEVNLMRCKRKDCRDGLFGASNNMDPGIVPDCLKNLTFVEQRLIAQVTVCVSYFHLHTGGQLGYTGNIINFWTRTNELAKQLPRDASSISSVVILNAKPGSRYSAFDVSGTRLRKALEWLKDNNPYYADIEIDRSRCDEYDRLQNIYDLMQTLSLATHDDPVVDENSLLESSGMAGNLGSRMNDQVNNAIQWPTIDPGPLNEWESVGRWCRAFPTLFPTGVGDFLAARPYQVKSLKAWGKHFLNLADPRFAQHPTFRYVLLNTVQRMDAHSKGTLFVKKSLGVANNLQLRAKIQANPELVKACMFWGATIPGTDNYWRERSQELQAFIRVKGSPTVFLTFSAGDNYWAELYDRLAGPDHQLNTNETFGQRMKLVRDNPGVVSRAFVDRFEAAFTCVIKPLLKVEEHWYR